ncbi:MAG: hypothetical protein KUG77_01455 [Nannocystaceae bacterium]|nr:hypothetical protein [Nannocystaceae bacterium]
MNWHLDGCFPVSSEPGQPGEPCTMEDYDASGLDSCAAGSMCYNVTEETLQGTCFALCEGTLGNPSCADSDALCDIQYNGALPLCKQPCDPLEDSCPEGEGCYPFGDFTNFSCALDKSDVTDVPGLAGDECEFINHCAPGLVCFEQPFFFGCDTDLFGCCTEFCDLDDPAPDGGCSLADQVCIPWHLEGEVVPEGLENVGFCYVDG